MIFEKVRDILCEQLDADESAITMNSDIADDLGADSIDVVDLIMSLEDEFELEMPDEEVANIKTVGDIVNYIEANK
ncbi:MAG: acyl carrier protein [Clostridia bacterium]|nr:acyl carrier protein [Clostridia bacterium]